MKKFDLNNDYFLRANFVTSIDTQFVYVTALFTSYDALMNNEKSFYSIAQNEHGSVVDEFVNASASHALEDIRERFSRAELLLEAKNDVLEYVTSSDSQIDFICKHKDHGTCVFFTDCIDE